MAKRIPSPTSFYRQIMSFKPRAPKKKAKKLKKAPAIKSLNLLSIFLEADAGESEGGKKEFYKKFLKNLNRTELTRLMKKINKIASDLIEDEEELSDAIKKLSSDTIEPLIAQSLKQTKALEKKVQNRLKKFPDLVLLERNLVEFGNVEYSLQSFVKRHFSKIINEYNSLVKEGLIIPNKSEKRGSSFVRRSVRIKLSSQAEQ